MATICAGMTFNLLGQNLSPALAALALGYVLGSIPFGAIVAENWKKVDLRQLGSGNIGAANAFIVAGKLPGVLVLIGDAAKGVLAVLAAGWMTHANQPAVAAAAVGAVLGHDWSLFLHFKGGRGTSTTIGVMLALDWRVLGLAALAYLTFFILTRYTVISSLVAVASMPVAMVLAPWMDPWFGTEPLTYVYCVGLIAGVGYLRHWDHVERLLQGREPKAGDMFREMKAAVRPRSGRSGDLD
ncbi:MAG: glycerol-3-phosphate 1-O-acyltransferase PlsY [Chloroflexota bacterium]